MNYLRCLAAFLSIGLLPISYAAKPCNDFMPEYYGQVDRIVDVAVGKTARLSLTTFPSFYAESGVRLVGADVYFVQLLSFLWAESYAGGVGPKVEFAKVRVKTKTFQAKLRADIADRVEAVYAHAISRVRPSQAQGLDGVTYRFAIPRAGCGEVWSPSNDTPDSRLVMLGELLEKHAQLTTEAELKKNEAAIDGVARSLGGA